MNFIKNGERGIAIFMVLATIAVAVPLVVMLTEETYISIYRADNIEKRAKARLVAESALKFAMARLKLYQEAFNFVQNKKGAKDFIKQENLDLIWNFPFVYPIPVTTNMNAVQKLALQKFQENSFLEGSYQLTINNISNKINLNMLRISLLLEAQKQASIKQEEDQEPEEPTEEELQFSPESQLIKTLQNKIELKAQNDESFDAKYYGIEIIPLVNELRYYISDPNSVQETGGADRAFSEANIIPKMAPLFSFSELYSLPSWPDDIVELIKDEFTVHGAIMVDLNQITDTLLRLLIPDILPEDIEEFFNYKNNPDDPKYFNELNDFKNYIVNIANIMRESEFDERFNNFQKQGLQFGPTPTLFRVSIDAQYGEASYKLTAYVTIPAKPEPRPVKKEETEEEPDPPKEASEPPRDEPETNKKKEEPKTQLLTPRIVEIIVG